MAGGEHEIPGGVWAKLDLIYDRVQKTDIAVTRIDGDNKLQNAVLQQVAETVKDHKSDTKELLAEIRADYTALKLRIENIERWQNRIIAVGSAIAAVFLFFGDLIKAAVGKFWHG